MPKKSIYTSPFSAKKLIRSLDQQLEYNSLVPSKTHYIQKQVHHACKNKEKQLDDMTDILAELLSVVNKQFKGSAKLFRKKSTKLIKSPDVTEKKIKLELQLQLLPTIQECPKIAQQEQEHTKKEKDQTQSSNIEQKVW